MGMIPLSDVQVGEQLYVVVAPNFVLSLARLGQDFRYQLTRRWSTRRYPNLSSFYAIVLANEDREITLRPTVRLNGDIVNPAHETEPIGYQFLQQVRRFTGQFNNPTRERLLVPGSTFSSRRRIAETRHRFLPNEQAQIVYSLPLYEEVRIG
jgi:hypothetical protein